MKKYSAIFLLLVLSACSQESTQKFSGTLQLTEYSVGVRTSGRITTLTVDDGSPVKKGDVIATLDRFEQAKHDYNRLATLQKQGGASEQAVEQAELALEDQSVVSPIDGIVLLKLHEIGEVLPAGNPVATLGDDRHPWVRLYVPENIVSRLQINQSATLEFDGWNQKFKGHVIYIAPQAEFTPRNVQSYEERITQTFAVKVALDDVGQGLRPGVATDVWLTLPKP